MREDVPGSSKSKLELSLNVHNAQIADTVACMTAISNLLICRTEVVVMIKFHLRLGPKRLFKAVGVVS